MGLRDPQPAMEVIYSAQKLSKTEPGIRFAVGASLQDSVQQLASQKKLCDKIYLQNAPMSCCSNALRDC